jgi:hypothetical protein
VAQEAAAEVVVVVEGQAPSTTERPAIELPECSFKEKNQHFTAENESKWHTSSAKAVA